MQKLQNIRVIVPGLALLISLVLVAACAVMEPPPGGPVDLTPPWLVHSTPDSAVTNVSDLSVITLVFSEKMDRQKATSWLHFFPDQRIKKTSWHGATKAKIYLEEPFPADTLIVMEIAGGMNDAHRVPSKNSRRFPFATGDSIYAGEVNGLLVMGDSSVADAVLELYDIPPDTLEYFQQPIVRRTVTNAAGQFKFKWLPVPGGPWLIRAYTDKDGNLRPGDRDAKRLLPDTLGVTVEEPVAAAGINILYVFDTPGTLNVPAFGEPDYPGYVMAWAMPIADSDTGWTPAPENSADVTLGPLDWQTGGSLTEVPAGELRVVAFVDVDGDSLFSVIPDTLLSLAPHDTSEVNWTLEPWQLIEPLAVEPGLESTFTISAFGDTLTPWTAPEPEVIAVPADSLSLSTADADSIPPAEEIEE